MLLRLTGRKLSGSCFRRSPQRRGPTGTSGQALEHEHALLAGRHDVRPPVTGQQGTKTVVTADTGSGRTPNDRETVARVLIGLGRNPNVASVIGLNLVIMTYYGVNYFLVGLHSYAGGSAFSVPPWGYGVLAAEMAFVLFAFFGGAPKRRRTTAPAQLDGVPAPGSHA